MALYKSSAHLFAIAAVVGCMAQGQTFPQPSCTKATNPPPNSNGVPAICGQRGIVENTFGHTSQTADNLQQCQNACLRRQALKDGAGCVQFTYNQNTKVCILHSYNGKFTPNAASPVTVTDARCFNCSAVCPNAIGQNLLDIPAFETVNKYTGPWFSASYINTTIVHPGYKSKNALYTTCDNFKDGCPDGWLLEQSFNGCKGGLYKAEFDYKASYGRNSQPGATVQTGDLDVFLGGTEFPSDQWKHFVSYFHSNGDNGNAVASSLERLRFFLSDQNWSQRPHYGLTIDNLSITSINKDLTVPATSPQLVPNGNFESGNLGPWKVSSFYEGTTQVKKPGLGSSKSALYASKDFYSAVYYYQNLPSLVAGTEYLVSLDYSTTSNSTSIQFSLGNTQRLYKSVCNAREPCLGRLQWPVVAHKPFGAPGNLTIEVGFGDPMDPAVSTFVLDNVSIKKLSQ